MSDSTRLFVGNLWWDATVKSLRAAFQAHGKVTDATKICEVMSGRTRCFGYVTYSSPEEADAALAKIQVVEVDGRTVRVERAKGRN